MHIVMSDSTTIHDDEVFLSVRDVAARVGLDRATIYRLIADDRFPKSRRYSGVQRVFWLQSEIRTWQQQQVSAA